MRLTPTKAEHKISKLSSVICSPRIKYAIIITTNGEQLLTMAFVVRVKYLILVNSTKLLMLPYRTLIIKALIFPRLSESIITVFVLEFR